MMHRSVLRMCIVLALTGTAYAQTVSGTNLLRWVRGIEGQSPQGRRDFVKSELRKLNCKFRTMPFDTVIGEGARARRIVGENIIVGVGKGTRRIVVGAHLDAVPSSPGANDNGGGVAVLLGLVKALRNHSWNYAVEFCFFDQEEAGLVGSHVYVRVSGQRERHHAMINLDVVGTGEEIYVGPTGGGDDDHLMPIIRKAAQTMKLRLQEREFYPPSDWASFAAQGLENISISVVPKSDADLLAEAVRNQWKIDSTKVPQVMKVMHTPEDKSTHVSPDALSMAFEFTKTVLVLLNQLGNKP
jgi:hypothetical protein